jgi:hypothetical protein
MLNAMRMGWLVKTQQMILLVGVIVLTIINLPMVHGASLTLSPAQLTITIDTETAANFSMMKGLC